MRIDKTHRILSGHDQLRDQSVTFAKLDLLLRQPAEIRPCFFSSPSLLEAAEQQVIVGIHTDLPAPFGKQEVLPVPGDSRSETNVVL